MAFSSNTNKGLLWNTLNEGGLFKNIENEKVNEIKIHFENIIQKINIVAQNGNLNGNSIPVLDLNKQFISEFSQYLNSLRKTAPSIEEVYTSQHFSEKRQKDFNYAVKQQQIQRQENTTVPKEINFEKDKNKEEPIKDMDNQLAKMMAERDLVDSGLITEKEQKKAEQWINNGKSKKNEIIEKRVSFEENSLVSQDNLLDKLKLIDNQEVYNENSDLKEIKNGIIEIKLLLQNLLGMMNNNK